MAIGLGNKTGGYTGDLINPILTCLSDPDSRVRYYACESLYNVVKVLPLPSPTLRFNCVPPGCPG